MRVLVRTVATLTLVALLPLGPAATAVPALEGFPTYHPQTRCNPTPKPGTVMLANYLMRRYPGSGSLGISRSCAASGVSEHKEGRAFDWALDVHSRRDRHYAHNFIRRIRATDRFGRHAALARRMGIMYVIWNDHIYSATHHYRRQPYLNAGCKNLRRCSVAERHRNHMHISLTRRAARGNTSWYLRHGATPRPAAHTHRAHKAKRHLTAAQRRRNHHIYYRRHHRHHHRHMTAAQRRRAHHIYYRRHHRHHHRHLTADQRSVQAASTTTDPTTTDPTTTDPTEDQGAGVSQTSWENLADRFQVSASTEGGTLSSAT